MPDLRRPAALLAASLAFASACGKTENDWPVTPPSAYTYSEFSEQLPEFLCSHLMHCPAPKAEVLLPRALFRTIARCMDVFTRELGDPSRNYDPRPAVKAGRIVFHDDAARAYLDRLAGPCDSSDPETDPTAGGALEGTVATGGSCVAAVECEKGNYCDHGGGACPGVCTKLKPTGEACADAAECASTYCSAGLCSKLTVASPAPAGKPCGLEIGAYATMTPCDKGLFCQGQPTGICRPEIPGDAPCTSPDDICELDHLCLMDIDGSRRCRPVAIAQDGEACTGETKPAINMCDAFSSLSCDQGTCTSVASGAQGTPCVRTAFGDSCASGLYCAEATLVCEPLGQTGDPCTAAEQCASGWCVSGDGTCSEERCE
jgi:hypothetical protein